MESRHKKRHTAAAKAALAERVYGTAEAVPLRKTLAATHGTQPVPEKSRRFARDAILRHTAKSNVDGAKPSRFHAAMNEATARINFQSRQSGVEPPFDCAQDKPHSKKSPSARRRKAADSQQARFCATKAAPQNCASANSLQPFLMNARVHEFIHGNSRARRA